MAVMLGSSSVSLYLGSTAITSVFLGSAQVDDDEPVEPPLFARASSTNTTMSIHSGHSLTDAYAHVGPFPGNLRSVLESVGYTDQYDKLIVSVIPGSNIQYRYENDNTMTEGHRAYSEIDSFHTLMITEAGPPPQTTSEYMVDTLDYFCRFAANTIENGAGNEVILWSIWPALNGPGTSVENTIPSGDWEGYTFRTGLPEYENSFKYMADYATWKMHQLYPSLPEDWRVWLFPGHKWMERVYDDIQNDLVPGVTDIQELFGDDIHPTPVGGYGLSCLVASCLYQVNLTDVENVWIMPGYEDWQGVHPAVPQALAEYFWQIAWEIATSYEPVGMGGTEGAALRWQPTDGDPMPNWTLTDPNTGGGGGDPDPDPEPGDLPQFAITATADDFSDLSGFSGTQPTAEDGVLKFEGGTSLSGAFELPAAQYGVIAVQAQTTPAASDPFMVTSTGGVWWQSEFFGAFFNGHLSGGSYGASSGSDSAYTVGVGTSWSVFEWWTDGETIWAQLDGGTPVSETLTDSLTGTDYITMFGNMGGTPDFHVAALGVCDHVPTPEERAAARAWAQAAIPEE